MEGRGRVYTQGALHMVAVLANLSRHWVGHFSAFLHKQVYKTLLSPCGGSISCIVGSFQPGRTFTGQRALTIESLLRSGCVQGC